MLRHAPGELALAHDRRGQHRIRGGHAGRARQALQPGQRRDHPPDEQAGHQPAPGHDGQEEQDDRLPVPLHVGLGQFDPDGETLDDEDDPRALQGDLVDVAPRVRDEEVGRMGTEDDAAQRRDGGLADVELLLHEQRAQHEQRREASQDHVRHMGLIDIEMVPGHGDDPPPGCGLSCAKQHETTGWFFPLLSSLVPRHSVVSVQRSRGRPRGSCRGPVSTAASTLTGETLHAFRLDPTSLEEGGFRNGALVVSFSSRRGAMRGRKEEGMVRDHARQRERKNTQRKRKTRRTRREEEEEEEEELTLTACWNPPKTTRPAPPGQERSGTGHEPTRCRPFSELVFYPHGGGSGSQLPSPGPGPGEV
ncbi:hypothetical protein VTN02DRAFT_5440 [Thermoascus thermophilus]